MTKPAPHKISILVSHADGQFIEYVPKMQHKVETPDVLIKCLAACSSPSDACLLWSYHVYPGLTDTERATLLKVTRKTIYSRTKRLNDTGLLPLKVNQ